MSLLLNLNLTHLKGSHFNFTLRTSCSTFQTAIKVFICHQLPHKRVIVGYGVGQATTVNRKQLAPWLQQPSRYLYSHLGSLSCQMHGRPSLQLISPPQTCTRIQRRPLSFIHFLVTTQKLGISLPLNVSCGPLGPCSETMSFAAIPAFFKHLY